MKYYRAAINTAGMDAGQVYEVEDGDERAAQLIEAGFLTPMTKKAVGELGLDVSALSDDDDGSVPDGAALARSKAKTAVPEVPSP